MRLAVPEHYPQADPEVPATCRTAADAAACDPSDESTQMAYAGEALSSTNKNNGGRHAAAFPASCRQNGGHRSPNLKDFISLTAWDAKDEALSGQ
jgi:hypothetical protein